VIVVEATGPVIVLGRTYAKTSPNALPTARPTGNDLEPALAAGQVGYLAGLRSDANFRTKRRGRQRRQHQRHLRVPLPDQQRRADRTATLADVAPGKRASQTRALISGQSAAFAESA